MSNQEILLGGGTSYISNFLSSGGTKTTDGSYTVHTFTGSGTFTFSSAPIGFSVEYLVAAGGGGGGRAGGGGGAGGLRIGSISLTDGSYTVTIGAGGAGGQSGVQSSNGENSVFDSVTATCGGGGGNFDQDRARASGKDGGSGGGAFGYLGYPYPYNVPAGLGIAG